MTGKESEVMAYVEEKKRIVLEFLKIRKVQVFNELIETGLTEKDLHGIIDDWRHHSFAEQPVKKEGVLVLQGILACIHTFQVMAYSDTRTKSGRISFHSSLSDLGQILFHLAKAGTLAQGKDARKILVEFASESRALREKLSAAETDALRKQTSGARKAKKEKDDEARDKIVGAYRGLKKENPKVTKDAAAIIIEKDSEINGGRGFTAIRRKLRNI